MITRWHRRAIALIRLHVDGSPVADRSSRWWRCRAITRCVVTLIGMPFRGVALVVLDAGPHRAGPPELHGVLRDPHAPAASPCLVFCVCTSAGIRLLTLTGTRGACHVARGSRWCCWAVAPSHPDYAEALGRRVLDPAEAGVFDVLMMHLGFSSLRRWRQRGAVVVVALMLNPIACPGWQLT